MIGTNDEQGLGWDRVCEAQRSNESPSGAFKRQRGLRQQGGNEAKIRKYIRDQEAEDQMCDQLSFKEYEDPFKNVADFDDDDSPEVPTDSMRKQERRQYAVDVAHCAPFRRGWYCGPYGAVLHTPRFHAGL